MRQRVLPGLRPHPGGAGKRVYKPQGEVLSCEASSEMLIPIRDENPPRRFPAVTVTLILLNVIIFLWDRGWDPFNSRTVFVEMTMVPRDVMAAFTGGDKSALLPLFTSMFLHGGIAHLLGNMLFLWIFGNNVEDTFGPLGFVILYLFWGLCASALHIFVAPGSNVQTLGASGAIAGVLGSYLMLFPTARIDTLLWALFVFVIEMPAWLLLGFWFVMQVLPGFQPSGVATWAHTGGFVAGVATIVLLGGRKRVLRKARASSYEQGLMEWRGD
jgi:membrane associated rhomboid family serine protease